MTFLLGPLTLKGNIHKERKEVPLNAPTVRVPDEEHRNPGMISFKWLLSE